jgi:hypothetical protein
MLIAKQKEGGSSTNQCEVLFQAKNGEAWRRKIFFVNKNEI